VLWAAWHLPFFITGMDHWNEILQIIAWTVVFAWIVNNTQGSVLLVMLMHAMSNTVSGSFISQMFTGTDSMNQAWLRGALWCLVAVTVVATNGPAHLSRKHPKWLLGNSGDAERVSEPAELDDAPAGVGHREPTLAEQADRVRG
jgi:hypothetical protein